MKALPLAYNRDLQEDKTPLFDTVDTVKACLEMMRELVRQVRVKKEKMLAAARGGFMNATDLADYLVSRGMSFRSAHSLVGRIVRYCLDSQRRIEQLSLEELRGFSPRVEKDVYDYLSLDAAVERRRSVGGTSSANVRRRLREIGV
jgi:argininosuccinate lyase